MKNVLLLTAALLAPAAYAQTSTVVAVTPSLEVQRLAPQLVAFSGSEANFANLVNGLALGLPVTLTTPLSTGGMQVFTFTPAGTMTPLQIAQTLETARQSLIASGIATPNAQQLGTAVTGGTLATAVGTTPVNPLVSTVGGTTGTSVLVQSPAVAVQNATSATTSAVGGTAPRNTSDSPFPRGISDTPPLPVPGVTASTPAPAAGTASVTTGAGSAAKAPVAR